MKLIPKTLLNSRLIVSPLPKEDEQVGNIIIPGVAGADLSTGIVLAVAEDIKTIKPGELVVYGSGSGVGQFFNGQQCIWLTESEIWAVDAVETE